MRRVDEPDGSDDDAEGSASRATAGGGRGSAVSASSASSTRLRLREVGDVSGPRFLTSASTVGMVGAVRLVRTRLLVLGHRIALKGKHAQLARSTLPPSTQSREPFRRRSMQRSNAQVGARILRRPGWQADRAFDRREASASS